MARFVGCLHPVCMRLLLLFTCWSVEMSRRLCIRRVLAADSLAYRAEYFVSGAKTLNRGHPPSRRSSAC
jgi:hypothetical protein